MSVISDYLMVLCDSIDYEVLSNGMIVNDELVRKQLWSVLRYYTNIYL